MPALRWISGFAKRNIPRPTGQAARTRMSPTQLPAHEETLPSECESERVRMALPRARKLWRHFEKAAFPDVARMLTQVFAPQPSRRGKHESCVPAGRLVRVRGLRPDLGRQRRPTRFEAPAMTDGE